MKINKVIRDIYDDAEERYLRLSEAVCARLKSEAEVRGWFFLSRVKKLDSFALKIETGRVLKPSAMEDFFACTIVVPSFSVVAEAERLIVESFVVVERKPLEDSLTHKRASEFVFDDLRLYVRRGDNGTGRDEDLNDLVFEVQIKTILQYAWGVATHGLIYKTDSVSWPKERIAFQVKAMLEHAEIAIAEAERLAETPIIGKVDAKTKDILDVLQQIEGFWDPELLPLDKKRLAENILRLLAVAKLEAKNLGAILTGERARLGIVPVDLSPYAFLVQALLQDVGLNFESKFKGARSKLRLLVHQNMDLPAWVRDGHERIIFVDDLRERPAVDVEDLDA